MNPDGSPPVGAPDNLERAAGAPTIDQVHVFVIFDVEHDRDLYELLHAQSNSSGCAFGVIGGSEGTSESEPWRENVRRQIREADQVIVICGEHTEASPHMHAELLIATDEKKPYFLLWGRRGIMCTKPSGAKPAEGMYSWTLQFLYDQIDFNLRRADKAATAMSLSSVTRGA